MATVTCKVCGLVFTGRPKRSYCGATCKAAARRLARKRQRQARHAAWLASLTPEERQAHEAFAAWVATLPTLDELFGDLPPTDWGEPTDWGNDLPGWDASDLLEWDWSNLPEWDTSDLPEWGEAADRKPWTL